MKLGIVGSRRRNSFTDKELIRCRIRAHNPDMIISGGCQKGADRFAEEIADELGLSITIFRPDFRKLTSTRTRFDVINVYYERNKKIAEASDCLVALVASDRKGGTENTIEHFKFKCGGKTWEHRLEIYKGE